MAEEKGVQEMFVLGQIRDAMTRQVELSEQFLNEMKVLHKRVDGVKTELGQLGDTMGEVNSKVETLKGLGVQRNQFMEQLVATNMDDVLTQLMRLNDKMDAVRSNGVAQMGWLENVAGTGLEAIATLGQERVKLTAVQNDLLDKGVNANFDSIILEVQHLKNSLNTLEKWEETVVQKADHWGTLAETHLASQQHYRDNVGAGLESLVKQGKSIQEWLERANEQNLTQSEKQNQEQLQLRKVPFISYKYLWAYGQFFTGTQQHNLLQEIGSWVLIEAMGTDLDGSEFRREGWLHVASPQSIWVIVDYEKVEKEEEIQAEDERPEELTSLEA